METILDIPVKRVYRTAVMDIDFDKLEFGRYVSDHMLVCDFHHGEWEQAAIIPYGDMPMNPASQALHYGQTVFEGMKAFYREDGRITIFRIEKHYTRFARSLERMCMAMPPREIFEEGLKKLIKTDKAWVPRQPGSSLYIRPFVIATEARFGVKISEEYRFIIFSGPVPEIYSRPMQVKVETRYTRASRGGTGYAKCGGNYGGVYYPTRKATQEGYDQVLWTDSQTHGFIEESGYMNVFFVLNGKLVTPPKSDSILDGVTRDSLITLAKDSGMKVEERPVAVAELAEAAETGRLHEAFGAGTAAVVSPIGLIGIGENKYTLPEYTDRSLHRILKDKLTAIRTGTAPDVYGWNTLV